MEHVKDLFLHGKINFPNSMCLMTPFKTTSIFYFYLYTIQHVHKSGRIYTEFKI